MKEGWKYIMLGEVCEKCKSIKWKDIPQEKNYIYIDLSAVSRDTLQIEETQTICASNAPSRARQIIYYDDILFATTRPTLRRVCRVPKKYDKQLCSTGFCVLRPQAKILSSFLFYIMQSDAFYSYIEPLQTGANYPAVTDDAVKKYIVPVPPISEQQRIVALLDSEFAKIDALKANAERNLQNAKDLFQAALKKELEPKKGWKEKTIGEISEIKGGKRVPKGYKLQTAVTEHPYIRVADFNDNGSVNLDDIHYISDAVYEGIKRYIIKTNDVYISIAGTIGKSGIIPVQLEGANLTENACRLVLNDNLYNRFVWYCTTTNDFKAQIKKLTMQAAQPKLALTRLATATIFIAPLQDQQAIVARLDALNKKCKSIQANYEKTIALCDDLKQALLRQAFNGKI